MSFCLHSPQVCIQLVSSTWLEGSNLANRSRTPQNASRAEKQKRKCKLYSLRKIDIFCYVHKTDGPQLRHPLPNHSVHTVIRNSCYAAERLDKKGVEIVNWIILCPHTRLELAHRSAISREVWGNSWSHSGPTVRHEGENLLRVMVKKQQENKQKSSVLK